MNTTETMTADEAIAELTAVGAKIKVWQPYVGARKTIYVNGNDGRKLAEIWCSAAGHVNALTLWTAVATAVRS